MTVRIQEAASLRLDDIHRYTRDRRGADQADRYITDLFAAFDKIGTHGVAARPIPAEFGVEGFYFRHEHRFVCRRRLPDGGIGIATILHEGMHQTDRFRDDPGDGLQPQNAKGPAFALGDAHIVRFGFPGALDGFCVA